MIDATSIDSYQRDGAVCIRQSFSPQAIATLRAGIDANLVKIVE